MPGHGRATQREMEDLWRARVAEARARYEDAFAKCRAASLEWHERMTPSPDGAHALSKVQQEESAALHEYLRALRVFTDLLAYGRKPPEE